MIGMVDHARICLINLGAIHVGRPRSSRMMSGLRNRACASPSAPGRLIQSVSIGQQGGTKKSSNFDLVLDEQQAHVLRRRTHARIRSYVAARSRSVRCRFDGWRIVFQRERQAKHAPPPRSVFHPYAPSVGFDDSPADRQSQSDASLLVGLKLIKPLEDPPLLSWRIFPGPGPPPLFHHPIVPSATP